jgi:hypothetical protein
MSSPQEAAEKLMQDFRVELVSGGRPDLTRMLVKTIKEFEKAQQQPPTCTDHPRYKGARKPKNNCEHCWKLYLFKKDIV